MAPPPTGATFGLGAVLAVPLAFWDVVSFGRSFVKGMNSGAPGRYFRSGSGTLNPYDEVSRYIYSRFTEAITSSVWKFSSRQHKALSVAHNVEFNA